MPRQQLAGREQILQHGQDAGSTDGAPVTTSEEGGGEALAPADPMELASKPILTNPACSGYFVEPVSCASIFPFAPLPPASRTLRLILPMPRKLMKHFVQLKWMDHFLQNGETSGKITCPNQRCKAKLGNYDWVGVECGCKEWVIPVSTCALCESMVDFDESGCY